MIIDMIIAMLPELLSLGLLHLVLGLFTRCQEQMKADLEKLRWDFHWGGASGEQPNMAEGLHHAK